MKKQTLKQSKAQYLLGRNTMMKNAKNLLPFLENVSKNGITSDSSIEEIKSARIACCMVIADIYYEQAVMEDKTGETNPTDNMDDFLKRLLGENN